jgi:eukaryotic-like serine/threonine-protein kinase
MSPSEASQVPIGTVLEGKFRVTQEIGRGGMAAVYEAENIDIGKRVAVKILSAELITSRVVRERFIREARAAAAIHSPYICEVYDSGMFHDRPFLVMELLEGESLYDRLTRVRQLRVSTTMKVMRHVVRGLTKAHEAGVVHRDLKPENIFLTRDAEGKLLAKIVDFGLAKFYENRDGSPEKNVRLTREGALFGTPAYMSPEQARGQGEVDHRADLWALGCIVYECLTGRTVWDVQQGVAMILAQIARGQLPDPRAIRPDLPEAFTTWFNRALHPDLTQRFQSTREFFDSLDAALSEEALAAPPSQVSMPSADGAVDGPPITPMPLTPPAVADGAAEAAPLGSALDQVQASRPRRDGSSSATGAIGWLLFAGTVALTGYFLWLRPPASTPRAVLPAPVAAEGATEIPTPGSPVETGPGAPQVAEAQQHLREGKRELAVTLLQQAQKESPNVAGGLLAHVEVASENKGPCTLRGLGRPRPFSSTTPAADLQLLPSDTGLLVAWTDSPGDARKRHVRLVTLDDSLRRQSDVRDLTPEATLAVNAQIGLGPEHWGLFFWNSGPSDAGLFGRSLSLQGGLESPVQQLTGAEHGKLFPSVVAGPNGYWLLFSIQTADGSKELAVLPVSTALKASGPPRYLTTTLDGDAVEPRGQIVGDTLFITYLVTHKKAPTRVYVLRTKLSDPRLEAGLPSDGAADQMLGEAVLLREADRQAAPQLACDEAGCMVVWDDEQTGAFASYVLHGQPSALWHTEFSTKAKRPGIGVHTAGQFALAWYADDRVWFQKATRDGVGSPSLLTKVSGFQLPPQLRADTQPGDWFVGWRDYEAGHLELLVARASCSPSAR